MIWWEKTVEYSFVIEFLSPESFALPFDGNHEKLGDAIFSSDDRWILVEFKRSENELDTEKGKFTDYDIAELKLSGKDRFHFLVYGERVESKLELRACYYFRREPVEVSDILREGTKNPQEFCEYLIELYEQRIETEASAGEVEYGCVVGIKQDGSVSQSMSVVDYLKAANEYELAQKIKRKSSPQRNKTRKFKR